LLDDCREINYSDSDILQVKPHAFRGLEVKTLMHVTFACNIEFGHGLIVLTPEAIPFEPPILKP
jgi:hypothetical protein